MIIKHKIDQDGFKGVVEIDMPGAFERIQLVKSMRLAVKVDDGMPTVQAVDDIEIAEKMFALVRDRLISVDLVYGDRVFKDKEELALYNEAIPLLASIGRVLVEGLSLGEALKGS